MRDLIAVMRVESLKLQWWLLLGVIAIMGVCSVLLGLGPGSTESVVSLYGGTAMVYGWLFYPITAGILAGLVCRVDHVGGGWKLLLSLPVRRWQVYLVKYAIVAGLLGVSQVFLAVLLVGATYVGGGDPTVSWNPVGVGLLGGWVGVLPLAALQLWASSRWRGFGGPLALNVALTLPALFSVQSPDHAPWYPWGQPVLGMVMPLQDGSLLPFSTATLVVVIGGGFCAWLFGGLVHFMRADVT